MDPGATRTLGRCGVAVSQLGFGGAPLGDHAEVIDEAQAHATLGAAWDAGVRYYDTSPWYGRGQSEHRLGRYLYRQSRNAFVLSTKVGRVFFPPRHAEAFDRGPWAGGLDFDHAFDYSYDGLMRAYEDSQQRLGLTRIDLLLIHDLDFWHHETEARVTAYMAQLAASGWRALATLRAAGLVRGIGAGINHLGMIPRFLETVDVDFFLVAGRYTLLEQDVLEAELPACAARDIGIVVGGVFNSGILATGPDAGAWYDYAAASDRVLQRVRDIQAVCDSHAVPMAAAALQFPLGHASVASVIPGAFTPAQVAMNAELFQRPIPAALWSDLKAAGLIREDAPTPD